MTTACPHRSWEEFGGGGRRCVDCNDWLTPEKAPAPDLVGSCHGCQDCSEHRARVRAELLAEGWRKGVESMRRAVLAELEATGWGLSLMPGRVRALVPPTEEK